MSRFVHKAVFTIALGFLCLTMPAPAGAQVLDFNIDHFQAWTTDPLNVGPYPVALVDQFNSPILTNLTMIDHFANSVEKNSEPRLDPNAHLIWYPINVPQPYRGVVVRNQFFPDGANLKIKDAKYVLVPATKVGGGSPSPNFNGDLYICYDVVSAPPINENVTLLEQFHPLVNDTVTQTTYFCNPVRKGAPPSDLQNPDDHLVWYRFLAPGTRTVDLPITANDQFPPAHNLMVRDAWYLGVPSVKAWPVPAASTWGLAALALLTLCAASVVIMRRRVESPA